MPSQPQIVFVLLLTACSGFYIARAFASYSFRRVAAATTFAASTSIYVAPLVSSASPPWWLFPSALTTAITFALLSLDADGNGRVTLDLLRPVERPAAAPPQPPGRLMAAQPAFTGNLIGIPLVDVLQLIGLGQKSGTLLVVLDRGRFSLTFMRGMLVEAEAVPLRAAERGRGPAAPHIVAVPPQTAAARGAQLARVVRGILRLRTGVFNFQQTGDEGEPPAHAVSVESLLLDALREEDETRERDRA